MHVEFLESSLEVLDRVWEMSLGFNQETILTIFVLRHVSQGVRSRRRALFAQIIDSQESAC